MSQIYFKKNIAFVEFSSLDVLAQKKKSILEVLFKCDVDPDPFKRKFSCGTGFDKI